MRVVFFGDSITDMRRDRESLDGTVYSYGVGYVRIVADRLCKTVGKYEIFNRGVSGDRSVDLYARIGRDVWNLRPDILSVLVGVNDVWHKAYGNGVDIDRYEKTLENMLSETLERLPQTKIMLCEPFFLHGSATDEFGFEKFAAVRDYAAVVGKIAKKYNAVFVPLQDDMEKTEKKFGAESVLHDGVHPAALGANLIAEKWLEAFKKMQGVI